MKIRTSVFFIPIAVSAAILLSGCETTNSLPYKASTNNVMTIQKSMGSAGKKAKISSIFLAPGVEENLTCRLMGPVKVTPGKTLSQYIEEAFQEELFLAGVYDADSSNMLEGEVLKLEFSSVAPANWLISLMVKSNNSPGYTVTTDYKFGTSFSAYSACKNVADAFGPAVQQLLKQVVSDPGFSQLTN